MNFVETKEMHVSVTKAQENNLCTSLAIKKAIATRSDIVAFDIVDEEMVVGFAMLRTYESNCYFLWNFAIDACF